MDAKLTLKLDASIIEQAKDYAKSRNISLSKLIENYLQAVTVKNKENEITPLVESLTGVVEIEEKDYRKDYTDFLTEKYT